MSKHIIFIHGRGTKPKKSVKEKLVKKCLVAGLNKINADVARGVDENKIKTTIVYYGDILNRILVNADPQLKKSLVEIDGQWYEPDDRYDENLDKLLSRSSFTMEDYHKLLGDEKDTRVLDDVARIVSPVMSLFGLSKTIIPKLLPDLGAYLYSRNIGEGSAIRERLQTPLKQALIDGDDIAIVSHSMGCMIAYDVLWKFSRMSEYRELHDKKISLWLTLGSPLGEPAVQESLYDSNEPQDGKYPSNIRQWQNISATDDFVAHDGSIVDDFNEMIRSKLIDKIEDIKPRIYNFWVGSEGSNPHKLYGYLSHPDVAEKIIKWIQG